MDEIDEFINNLPVIISLQYKHRYLQFPVNPEEITKDIPSQSNKIRIEGIGEVATPSKPGLATINISSFFWQDRNLVPTSFYVDWLEKWQASKLPAKLIVTRFNYSMYVTCENFSHTKKAGEENDVYFDLQLQEYRSFGAKELNEAKEIVAGDVSFFQKSIDFAGNLSASILFDIPRPDRFSNKEEVSNPYKTKKGETILSICKKINGDTELWKELYNENKKKLGDILSSGDGEIPIGTELIIPNSWLS